MRSNALVRFLGGAALDAALPAKSRAEKLTALQVTIYCLQAMLNHADLSQEKPLPMIYPVIIHNGKKPFQYPVNVWDLVNGDAKDIRRFNEKGSYLLDLPNITDDELLAQPYFSALFPELLLKHIYDGDILQWFKNDPRVLKVLEKYSQEVGQKTTLSALQYAHSCAKISSVKEFARTVSVVDKVFGEEIMTAEQAAINTGVGLGKQEQQAVTASKMLAKKRPLDEIIEFSGLSITQIKELMRKQHSVNQPEIIEN